MRSAAALLGASASADVFAGQAPQWLRCYQVLQGAEIGLSLGAWLDQRKPALGPDIAPRFVSARNISADDISAQQAFRAVARVRLQDLLQGGTVLVMPTVPVPALRKDAGHAALAAFYASSLAINAIAGHAGLPQLVLPAGRVDGKPVSLSFIAASGLDEALLAQASHWAAALQSASSPVKGMS
jgi:amidase